MIKKLGIILLLLGGLLGGLTPATAGDLITSRAWLEDRSGMLSFEQAKAREFQPYTGVLSRGIGKGVIWIRLRFDPNVSSIDSPLITDRAILRVRPVYLDSVVLYDPIANPITPKHSGDLLPVSQDDYQSLNLNFVIPKGSTARDIYLRVETNSTRMVDASAFTFASLAKEDQALLIYSGFHLGIGILFLFWAITTWIAIKDRIVFAFIFCQAGALGIGFTVFGYARLWFSDAWGGPAVSHVLTLSAIVSVITACWFYLRLVSEFKPSTLFVWACRAGIAIECLALVIFLLGDTRTAVSINWTVAIFMPIVSLIGVATAKGWATADEQRRLLPRWVLLIYFAAIMFVLLAAGSAGIGLLPQGSAFNVYAPLTNGVVAGALAVTFLQYRVNLTQKYQNDLQLRATLSEKTAQKERENREERDQLLAMLGHELKTPLAAIRMLLGSDPPNLETVDRIRRAILEMNSVIDRSVQSGRVDSDSVSPQFALIDLHQELPKWVTECREPSAIQLELNDATTVASDYDFFRIIVLNLLDNACKYRAPGTLVHVRLVNEPRSDAVGSSRPGISLIIDNAPGPAGFPDPEKLFTKYYRSPMAHRQAGSGLGVYLIKGLIDKLGGSVAYAPTAERVRFVLWHPT